MTNLKELLIALYAFTVLYQNQTAIKEAYAALKSPALKTHFDDLPSLQPMIRSFLSGNYDDFGNLAAEMKDFTAKYKSWEQSRASIAGLLNSFTTWLRNGSPIAFKKIEDASASTVFPLWISANFVKQVDDQSKVNIQLRKLVQKMTGRTNEIGFRSPEEAAEAKRKFPSVYAEFLQLRRKFTEIWRSAVSNFVRTSGKKTIPYQDVLKYLAKAKIEHNMPLGFTGNIDAAGKWYSPFDELLGGSPPQANMFPTVRMNPAFTAGSDTWVFQAIRGDKTAGNYWYTTTAIKKLVKEKFQRVRDFTPMLPKIRAKWVAEIKNFNPSSALSVSCVVLEMIYQTSARVGGKKLGMSTLLRKHYSPATTGFILKYLGKDDVPTKHVFKGVDPLSKMIVKIVGGLVKDKKPNDRLFTFLDKRGNFRPVTPGMVNAAFRQMGAVGVSVHKIRTYHGTKIFKEQAEKIYKKYKTLTPAQAMDLLKQAATVVGKNLNHVRTTADGSTKVTPMTAISAYIDHTAQVEFFRHYQLPLPKHLEKEIIESGFRALNLMASRSDSESITAAPLMDTKPKEVPEPIGKPKTEETDKTEDKDQDSEKEDSDVLPQFRKDDPTPTTDEELDEEETAEDKAQEKARIALEKQADKFSYLLTYGGESSDNLVEEGVFDNVLVEDRFDPRDAP